MWELDYKESWELKNWWCWRRLLRVPWTARRSNQSILKEISPGCSLEGLMLKLKLQYFGHLIWRTDSLEKTLMLGKTEGRRRGRQDEMVGWHHRHNGHGFGWTPGIGDGQGGLVCCGSWGRKESDTTERLNWTELNNTFSGFPDSSVGKESACNAGDPSSIPSLGRSPGEGTRYPLQYSWASLMAQLRRIICNAWDLGSIPGLGRSPGKGKGYPLQYSGQENSMDCIVRGVANSQTRLSDFHNTF